jgi:hypothetical protein
MSKIVCLPILTSFNVIKICLELKKDTHTHTNARTHTHTHTHTRIYIYIYIYIYKGKLSTVDLLIKLVHFV